MADTNVQQQFNALVAERDSLQKQIVSSSNVRGGGVKKVAVGANLAIQQRLEQLNSTIGELLKSNVKPDEEAQAKAIVDLYQKVADASPYGSSTYQDAMNTVANYQKVINAAQDQRTAASTLVSGAKASEAQTAKAEAQKQQDAQNSKQVEVLQRQYDQALVRGDTQTANQLQAEISKLSPSTTSAADKAGATAYSPASAAQASAGAVSAGASSGSGKGTSTGSGSGTSGSGSGSSGTNASTSTTNGYTTVKGTLNFQGNPYTGLYNDKYYKNGKVQTDEQVKADFLTRYGEQARFIQSVPELSALLTKAMDPANNWSPAEWAAQFKNTTWAQTHPGDIGLAEIKRVSDPKQYNLEYNTAYNRAVTLANQLGITLSAQQLGAPISPENMGNVTQVDQKLVETGQDITNWILQNPNATDAQITQRMAQYGKIDPNAKGGTLAANAEALKTIAQKYGVYGQYSPDGKDSSFFTNYALNQAQGTKGYDPSTFEQQAKIAAMNTYKPFAQQIAAGSSVADLATPYMNTLTSLLEVSPADVTLGGSSGYGSLISKAMMGDGSNPVDPITFANTVRSQPQWLSTNNAKSTVLGGIDQFLQSFGFKGM